MNMRVVLLVTWLVFALGGLVAAQDNAYSDQQSLAFLTPNADDPGIPDTVRFEAADVPLGTEHFTVQATLYNDEEIGGFNLPMSWDSPDIICDSVSFVGSRVEYVNTKLFSVDNVNQRLQAGIIIFLEAFLQPGDGLIYTAYFTANAGAADQAINYDSTFYPPGGNFALTLSSGFNMIPQVIPGSMNYGTPPTNPTISLAPMAFSFDAVQGGANPPSQTLTITNTGAGTLNWTAAAASGWLDVNPASGTGDGSIDVSVDITGLTAGTYTDTVTISDPAATNNPQKAPVTLIIAEPPPTIVLNPTSFTYTVTQGDVLADDELSVTNSGGGTLNWTASHVAGWLSLNPASGAGDGLITISYDIAALTAGVYYDTITVADPSATNSPQKATIMLTVEEPAPIINLSPMSFSYVITEGEALANDHLSITNDGGGSLNWTATNLAPWLSLDPTSGTGDGQVTISYDVMGLTAGTYYDTIAVYDPAASNNPQEATVTIVVEPPPPMILLSPTVFDYAITEGNNLPDDQLSITNDGGGTLNWTASNLSGWMMLNPTSGTGPATVTMSFDVSGLAAGTYADTITVTDPAAPNSPQKAVVTLVVNSMPIPVISVSPTSMNFVALEGFGNPPSQTLNISNIGDGVLDWSVSDNADWLSLDPLSGTGDGAVTVSADGTFLTPGVYNAEITVTDPLASNSPVIVPVTFTMEAQPRIAADPTAFSYVITEGDALPDDELMISNIGGGTLNWVVANFTDWLSLDPLSGTDDGAVTLSFDVAGLAVGEYGDTIRITGQDAINVVYVPVSLTVNPPPPVIALDPTEINLFAYEGESIPDFGISITNTGGGVLNWTASNQSGWAMLDPMSGTGDGEITVSFDISGIMPGVYYDTVLVNDPAAVNTPQSTVITLTVYGTDLVEVETVSAFVGQQVEVGINYTNATPTREFTLPLSFVNTDVVCDSVSFIGTRVFPADESTAYIDNVNGTIEIFGFAINGPILDAGSGLIARMFFTVAGDAAPQFVPIDTAFIEPDGSFEFVDAFGDPKETDFTSGGIDISNTPCFDFPTDTVVFDFKLGDIVPSISFPVTNTCGGVLEWTVTGGASWLTLSPNDGIEADLVTFGVDTTSLSPGNYETTATFESNGFNTPYMVVVILHLRAAPILSVDPLMVDLGQICGGDTVIGTFDIANAGYLDLNWMADAMAPITLSGYSGTAPSTVSYSIYTGDLDYGHHSLEITINADEALHSPQTLTLDIFVVNCGECTFDIADAQGAQGMSVGVPVYTHGIADVAGLQFNIAYDPSLVTPDSVTSTYMSNPTIGYTDDQIHYVWDDIVNPITIPDGEIVLTLWVTPIGDIGQQNCFEWAGTNEISDPYGIPYEGVIYCGGCLTVLSPYFSLSGDIMYYDMAKPVPYVQVDLTGDATGAEMTDEYGHYAFMDVPPDDYTLTPWRSGDDLGVSVADAIKIERHLAFVEEFDSAYKLIAADVNLSNSVTVSDVVLIKRYLAELDELPSGNWSFVDADYAIDKDNWMDAPHTIDASLVDSDLDLLDFVGIRMGDVNGTWYVPFASRKPASDNIELAIPDIIVAPATDIVAPVIVTNFANVAGIEIHITYDMAQATVDSIVSPVLTDATVNSVDGRAHLIWADFENPVTLADGEALIYFYFHILPTASGDLPLNFMASCELTDEIGNPYPLTLTNGKLVVEPTDVDDQEANLPLNFELKQNYPNPFNPTTTISYTVDKTMSLVFEVYNVSGQVVDRIDLGRKSAGAYSLTYHGDHLASGIYTYRLIGDGVSLARQMVLVK